MSRPSPTRIVTANTPDNMGGSNQRSSGWVVAIVAYNNPASMSDEGNHETNMIVIQNDAIGVNINNPKGSFGKMCSLSLKSTDIWYPGRVSPGDWVAVWMHDNEEDLERVTKKVEALRLGQSVGNSLCNDRSGLKFVGRVTGVTHNDTVSPEGQRVTNQSISAQAFIEFATSVYYTASIKPFVSDAQNTPGASGGTSQNVGAVIENIQFGGLDDVLKNIANKYKDIYARGDSEFTPDIIITLFFIIIMGISKNKTKETFGVEGTFNNGIHIPSRIARLFNKPKATKVWQIMNVLIGVQDFIQRSGAWYKSFEPVIEKKELDVFRRSPVRCKGFVPFQPALWDNVSMWSILSKYLNPVSNEMYTALKINREGRIVPTLTVREKPFSTGLFHKISDTGVGSGGKLETTVVDPAPPAFDFESATSDKKTSKALDTYQNKIKEFNKTVKINDVIRNSLKSRTLFGKLPRWLISESVVRSFSYSSNEAARINFVQVWGRDSGAVFTGSQVSHQTFTQQQFNNGNFYIDQQDISRNGLRAYIVTSEYDTYFNSQTEGFAKLWAKLNADWLFNGQLKASGSIRVDGVVDPICEGDNLEFRGILFHIDSVNHQGSLSPEGRRQWITTVNLSNGIIASSLNDPENGIPKYPAHRRSNRDELGQSVIPGYTEIQRRIGDKSKGPLGDSLKAPGSPNSKGF